MDDRWDDLVLHPVRIRVLRALAGRRLTTRDLVAELADVPPASLYRHLARLAEGGAVDVVEERRVRGAIERVYALGSVAADPAAMTREDHARAFTAFMSTLLADFTRYLGREDADPLADGVGYRELVLHLSDAEFASFAREMSALIAPLLANEPGGDRRARMLATVVMPVDGPHAPTPTNPQE